MDVQEQARLGGRDVHRVWDSDQRQDCGEAVARARLQPEGEPELVDVHDFPGDAVGKAIPYGVYDVAANDGFVSVGIDHDMPVFAVTSIEAW